MNEPEDNTYDILVGHGIMEGGSKIVINSGNAKFWIRPKSARLMALQILWILEELENGLHDVD